VAQQILDPDAQLGELISRMSQDMTQLLRDELRLAQAEMIDKAKNAGRGAGFFAGAGLIAGYGLGALAATAILGLDEPLPGWVSALVIGGGLLGVAGLSALLGKHEDGAITPPVPSQVIAGTKDDIQALMA
jgi:hypothetical protein